MNVISIIPARMNSSRFPGKPMKKILGIPMIGHCFYRSNLCKNINNTYVATCDEEIHKYILSIGGKSIMTSNKHERASDRTSEALKIIEDRENVSIDIVVMIQGDEPMITPEMIDLSVTPFKDKDTQIVNLMTKINSNDEFNNPNEIKVVVDKFNNALYFSREPIPSSKKYEKDFTSYKQVCIIPFRSKFLETFNNMEEVKIEKIESIDMLRLLYNGYKVKMVYSKYETYSVDTEEDLRLVEKKMKNDNLITKYNFYK